MESPPKRMTRARAAAKASEAAGPKTTKIVTAAAKAKTTATSSRTTATKRKTRADEHEEDEHPDAPNTRTTRPRGRPKKAVEEPSEEAASSSAATRPTRSTRAKKTTAEPPKAEAARTTRGRARKATTQQDEEPQTTAAEPVKKSTATRSRATGATKSSIKKTVTFEEPEKENIIPTAKGKTVEKPSTGLRARPVRKAAAAAAATTTATATARATRGTKAGPAEKPVQKTPLSPKKITQMRARQEDAMSDDELALPEMSPLKKSPIKKSIFHGTPRKAQDPARMQENLVANNAAVNATEMVEPSNALGSPARRLPASPSRDTMASPAKRIDALSLPPASAMKSNNQALGGTTPFKASLLRSPAKRCASAMKSMASSSLGRPELSQTPFKTSLLQTPAKRPMSGFKGFTSVRRDAAELHQSPATRPAILSTPTVQVKPSEMLMDGDEAEGIPDEMQQDLFAEPPPSLKFPGRLSAVLPRDADPGLNEMSTLEEDSEDELNLIPHHQLGAGEAEAEARGAEQAAAYDDVVVGPAEAAEEEDHEMTDPDEPAESDEPAQPEAGEAGEANPEMEPPSPATTTPPNSPPRALTMFGLRDKDLDPCQDFYDESEDELAGSMYGGAAGQIYATPTHGTSTRASGSRVVAKPSRMSNIGYTPLAAQFGAWSAASPVKTQQTLQEATAQSPYPQSAKSTFFDDEMSVRDGQDFNAEIEAAIEADIAAQMDEPVFDDMLVTQEDVDLAAEANEMSLMEPEQEAEMGGVVDHDDSVSDASQDYGDENQVPIDPALLGHGDATTTALPPATPNRFLTKTFHTVSKVPLKPADESTPLPVKKRSNSISRLPTQRPTLLSRNATVISYSPTKQRRAHVPAHVPAHAQAEAEETTTAPPVTPAKSDKSDIWSTLGTPNRTPRRDLDPALLRGAVVYVDVHTSEGADASGIFVELLGQMGARCVKTWSWTGNDSSKIGITHVVYKDGGKRTLEKIRDSAGVVQCVGVSWVLDCERENKWLDEAPYYIDTSLVPRGGARRRKSMEPKALANLNGAVVSSPVKQSRDSQTAPNTPFNRRDSYAWVRTPPEKEADAEGEDDEDWGQCMLTPVPRTPAPEDIHRFVENMVPETPTMVMDLATNNLMMQTCPPKQGSNPYQSLGEGILSPEKDQNVMMRLMAARRKSLQFAPKVASPLSKAWTKSSDWS